MLILEISFVFNCLGVVVIRKQFKPAHAAIKTSETKINESNGWCNQEFCREAAGTHYPLKESSPANNTFDFVWRKVEPKLR